MSQRRKASYSQVTGHCVSVATWTACDRSRQVVLVEDTRPGGSRHRDPSGWLTPAPAALEVPAGAWNSFLDTLR